MTTKSREPFEKQLRGKNEISPQVDGGGKEEEVSLTHTTKLGFPSHLLREKGIVMTR